MSNDQAYAFAGGMIGGFAVTFGIIAVILTILLIIALWKIFTKAGQPGWKSLIPVYNGYILCKIIGMSFWTWFLLIPFCVGFVSAFIAGLVSGNNDTDNVASITMGIYFLILDIVSSIKLGKAFNKSTEFIVGLILLPNIFELILGFGSSKYVGNK